MNHEAALIHTVIFDGMDEGCFYLFSVGLLLSLFGLDSGGCDRYA